MNKDQFARLARHRKVQQVLADNAAAVAAVPAFAKLAAQYQQQLGLLDGTARKKGVVSEGATLAKSAAGTALIARLVKAANALYLLYKAEEPTPNLTEAAKMHRRASDYTTMTDQALATEATDLAQRVTANKSSLMSDYNLTAASIKDLTDDARSFDGQLTAPQLAIDANKIKGATAKSTLSALNTFLRDDLRAGMELLKDTHEAAYKALREASQVDDAGSGKGKKPVTLPTIVLLLFLGSLLSFRPVLAQQVVLPYATPTKDLSLSITYSLKLRKDYKKYVPKKAAVAPVAKTKTTAFRAGTAEQPPQPAKLLRTKLLDATIVSSDDIALKSIIGSDPTSVFALELPEKIGGKHTLKFAFEEGKPLLLQTINMEYTPMTAEVITGTANLIGSALSIVATVGGAFGAPEEKAEPAADSSVIVEVKFVTLHDLMPKFDSQKVATRTKVEDTITLDALLADLDKGELKLPNIKFTAEPMVETFNNDGKSALGLSAKPDFSKAKDKGKLTLCYRNPAYYRIKVELDNNGSVSKQVVMLDQVSLPQFGSYGTIDLGANFKGGKKTAAVKLNNTTGGLAEYSLTRESVLSAVLASSATGADAINGGLGKVAGAETAKLKAQTERIQAQAALLKARKELEDASAPAIKPIE